MAVAAEVEAVEAAEAVAMAQGGIVETEMVAAELVMAKAKVVAVAATAEAMVEVKGATATATVVAATGVGAAV